GDTPARSGCYPLGPVSLPGQAGSYRPAGVVRLLYPGPQVGRGPAAPEPEQDGAVHGCGQADPAVPLRGANQPGAATDAASLRRARRPGHQVLRLLGAVRAA